MAQKAGLRVFQVEIVVAEARIGVAVVEKIAGYGQNEGSHWRGTSDWNWMAGWEGIGQAGYPGGG